MPSVSRNEIDGYARRAARGAGMSWGLAEESGRATSWLCARGLPGARLLHSLLLRVDAQDEASLAPIIAGTAPWRASGGRLCPIRAGAALSDRAATLPALMPLHVRDVMLPALLLPFLAQTATTTGGGFELCWSGVRVRVGEDSLLAVCNEGDALLTEQAAEVVVTCCEAPEAAVNMPTGSVTVDDGTWAGLATFAQRTYVPASEASRLRGAGAGGSDND